MSFSQKVCLSIIIFRYCVFRWCAGAKPKRQGRICGCLEAPRQHLRQFCVGAAGLWKISFWSKVFSEVAFKGCARLQHHHGDRNNIPDRFGYKPAPCTFGKRPKFRRCVFRISISGIPSSSYRMSSDCERAPPLNIGFSIHFTQTSRYDHVIVVVRFGTFRKLENGGVWKIIDVEHLQSRQIVMWYPKIIQEAF